MALQISLSDADSATGQGSATAYAMVSIFSVNNVTKKVGVKVDVFIHGAARAAGKQPIVTRTFSYDLAAGVTNVAGAYAKLKQEAMFKASVDV
jgi:hypothetical protein